jgi:hypothetical protein
MADSTAAATSIAFSMKLGALNPYDETPGWLKGSGRITKRDRSRAAAT